MLSYLLFSVLVASTLRSGLRVVRSYFKSLREVRPFKRKMAEFYKSVKTALASASASATSDECNPSLTVRILERQLVIDTSFEANRVSSENCKTKTDLEPLCKNKYIAASYFWRLRCVN